MRKVKVEGKICVGPTFSTAEFALIKRNLAEQQGLQSLAELFGLAANIHRLKILYLLHTHREMCVCDLAEVLEITESAVSQHLRRLKDRNLVKSRREGQTIYYSLVSADFSSHLHHFLKISQPTDRAAQVHGEIPQ